MKKPDEEIEILFSSETSKGREVEFGCDGNGKLYVNGKAVVTQEKIVLQGWMNAAIIITAIATLVQTICAILALQGSHETPPANPAVLERAASTGRAPAQAFSRWHDKLLQVMVRHPGGEWSPREARQLESPSVEQGNVKQAFVDVDFVDPNSRAVHLVCGSTLLATAIITPDYKEALSGTCYGVEERITLVSRASAKFPAVAP